MATYTNPYANQGAGYLGHNYQDSTDEYYYNPYDEQPTTQQPLDRSNTFASRYTSASAPVDMDPMQQNIGEFPPQGQGPNVLRRQSKRIDFSDNLGRTDIRQSLTPIVQAPGG
jgi:hypothetical protein